MPLRTGLMRWGLCANLSFFATFTMRMWLLWRTSWCLFTGIVLRMSIWFMNSWTQICTRLLSLLKHCLMITASISSFRYKSLVQYWANWIILFWFHICQFWYGKAHGVQCSITNCLWMFSIVKLTLRTNTHGKLVFKSVTIFYRDFSTRPCIITNLCALIICFSWFCCILSLCLLNSPLIF